MNNRILVTGGAGYVGSHTCKALADAGFEPIVYDNLSRGHEEFVLWGPMETGDLLDIECLSKVVRQYQPVGVLHFAALAYIGESIREPFRYYQNNVAGSINLPKELVRHRIEVIVFSSTCATYGNPIELPISETHPQNPISPYGRTKLMVERMLKDLESTCGLRSVSLRYFNAAGADRDGMIGEWHDPETHIIPIVLDVACGWRESVTVYGRDYNTQDGTCIRDFIHVEDLATAHVLSLQALLAGAPSEMFNLGSEVGKSVLEIIDTARRVTGRPISVEFGSRRQGDPPALVGDFCKIQGRLDWEPKRSDIEQIIADAWLWHQKRPVVCSQG